MQMVCRCVSGVWVVVHMVYVVGGGACGACGIYGGGTCGVITTFTTGFVHDVPKIDRLLFDQFLNFLIRIRAIVVILHVLLGNLGPID